jgi:hypothetical protein
MITDYQLVYNAKQGDRFSEYTLFSRYKKLAYKKYRTLLKMIPKQNAPEQEDYIQEAYPAMLRAIKYVDLSKIHTPQDWKFYQSFLWFLQSTNSTYLVQHTKNKKNNALEIPFPFLIEDDENNSAVFEDRYSITPSKALHQNSVVSLFYSMLTPEEHKLVALSTLPVLDKGLRALRSIGKELGISGERVRQKRLKIKKKWDKATTLTKV